MAITVCLLSIAVATFSLLIGGSSSSDSTPNMQAVMYTVLHNLALPNFDDSQKVTERFILMLPGEVLNYYDYCPLSESVGEFNPDNYNSFPPDENSFRLSDTLPTFNPLGGGLTGKSLSTIYENILYTIDTSTSESDPFSQESYTSAIAYLTELVPDPEGKSAPNVSRYELYYQYQKAYYDTKLQVNEWFDGNKTKLKNNYAVYTTWYKENYDSLTGYVSSAYTQWLISGLKGPVEDKISLVDVKSERQVVEEARQAMRIEALPSLDGASKYYPVHFVPSNWYKYLLASNEDNHLTRDQIQAKIADLTARRNQIQARNVSTSNVPELTQKAVKDANETLNSAAEEYNCYQYFCQINRTANNPQNFVIPSDCTNYKSNPDPCNQINELQNKLSQKSEALAEALSTSYSAINQLTATANTSISNFITQLNDEIAALHKQLPTAPKPIPPDVNKAKINGTGHLSPQEIEQNWMSFSFDSETSSSSTVTGSTTYKAAASSSLRELLWSVSGSASYSRSTQDFSSKTSSAKIAVSAKLLKVQIQRNWFRPSLFSVGSLKMEPGIYVSPGPMQDESNYLRKVGNNADADQKDAFLLPEYTTGFLLAKDVSMSFRGVNSSTVSHVLQQSASGKLSGHYGPFKVSTSFSYGHKSSSLKVSSHAGQWFKD